MTEDTELLREIRDLLLVIAEPALAKRDERCREALRAIVGSSQKKAKSALLMDGSRTQGQIKSETGIDQGDLSKLVKKLREGSLLSKEENPKLVITVPSNFFETK